MLGADRQPDRVAVDVLGSKLLVRQLAVGRGRRVDDKGLHVRHIGKQGEDLQVVDEDVGLLLAALDVEGEDALSS